MSDDMTGRVLRVAFWATVAVLTVYGLVSLAHRYPAVLIPACLVLLVGGAAADVARAQRKP